MTGSTTPSACSPQTSRMVLVSEAPGETTGPLKPSSRAAFTIEAVMPGGVGLVMIMSGFFCRVLVTSG